jgi:hypothetical protein
MRRSDCFGTAITSSCHFHFLTSCSFHGLPSFPGWYLSLSSRANPFSQFPNLLAPQTGRDPRFSRSSFSSRYGMPRDASGRPASAVWRRSLREEPAQVRRVGCFQSQTRYADTRRDTCYRPVGRVMRSAELPIKLVTERLSLVYRIVCRFPALSFHTTNSTSAGPGSHTSCIPMQGPILGGDVPRFRRKAPIPHLWWSGLGHAAVLRNFATMSVISSC